MWYRLFIRVFALTTISFFSVESFAQQPYYDAKDLTQYVFEAEGGFKTDSEKVREIANILIKYTGLPDGSDAGVVVDKFKSNPFISQSRISIVQIDLGGYSAERTSLVSGVLASVGGINVTKIADGLARFMVERAKHELGVAFFEKFKDALGDPAAKDLCDLFPKTNSLLKAIDKEIYNYNLYLGSLRKAFQNDLTHLLTTGPEVLERRLQEAKNERDNAKGDLGNVKLKIQLLSFACASLVLANGLNNGDHPGEVLACPKLDSLLSDEAISPDVVMTLRAFNVFSKALRADDPDRYWLEPGDFKDWDWQTMILFLGLVYQSADGIEWSLEKGGKFSVKDNILAPLAKPGLTANEAMEIFRPFMDNVKTVRSYVKDFRAKEVSKLTYNDVYPYFCVILDLFESAIDISKHYQGLSADTEGVDNFMTMARISADLCLDLKTKQYSSAIFNATLLLDETLGSDYTYRNKLITYGSFMAAVAEAENSDQVHKAIEAAALPPGSASIKRKTSFNVAINSYLGIGGGKEWYEGSRNWVGMAWAPVGVAVSFGSSNNALSIFASVIDIGAITTYRIKDDSTSTLPEFKLKNIFAPGINLVWGTPFGPISFGGGIQLGPQLREINSTTLETGEATYRWHIFGCVDIPIFNLYTEPK